MQVKSILFITKRQLLAWNVKTKFNRYFSTRLAQTCGNAREMKAFEDVSPFSEVTFGHVSAARNARSLMANAMLGSTLRQPFNKPKRQSFSSWEIGPVSCPSTRPSSPVFGQPAGLRHSHFPDSSAFKLCSIGPTGEAVRLVPVAQPPRLNSPRTIVNGPMLLQPVKRYKAESFGTQIRGASAPFKLSPSEIAKRPTTAIGTEDGARHTKVHAMAFWGSNGLYTQPGSFKESTAPFRGSRYTMRPPSRAPPMPTLGSPSFFCESMNLSMGTALSPRGRSVSPSPSY